MTDNFISKAMLNPLVGRATFLSLTVHGRSDNIVVWPCSMFTSLDSIGSAVVKHPIEHVIATGEWPNEYFNEHSHAIRP